MNMSPAAIFAAIVGALIVLMALEGVLLYALASLVWSIFKALFRK